MIERKTILSDCRKYRFTLWREFKPDLLLHEGFVNFIGLNPSTADETKDDATIRRCIGYAKAWGYGALCMTNLFAFRATFPSDLRACAIPEGDGCYGWIENVAREAHLTICAWGTHGAFRDRGRKVATMLQHRGVRMFCLGLNGDGSPKHPLRLSKALKPVPFVV